MDELTLSSQSWISGLLSWRGWDRVGQGSPEPRRSICAEISMCVSCSPGLGGWQACPRESQREPPWGSLVPQSTHSRQVSLRASSWLSSGLDWEDAAPGHSWVSSSSQCLEPLGGAACFEPGVGLLSSPCGLGGPAFLPLNFSPSVLQAAP